MTAVAWTDCGAVVGAINVRLHQLIRKSPTTIIGVGPQRDDISASDFGATPSRDYTKLLDSSQRSQRPERIKASPE